MKTPRSFVLLAALLLAGPWARSAEAEAPLALCLNNDAPPFSSAATPERGIDVEVAQALARQLGRTPRLVWVQVPNRGGLARALKQSLAAGQCDAYLGVPRDPDVARELAERKLLASGPYLTLGYVLVARAGSAPPTVAALRRARKVGAASATPADLYLHRMQLPRAPYPGRAALIDGLKAGEIDLALVWSSALTGERAAGLVQGSEAIDDADLYTDLTVATRSADAALSQQIAAAVEALRADGRFVAIARTHGLPRVARP
ncbi:MAG TPA: transporter substrate-binding domain-containing protein [Methylibium sp.]|nr:transporter substrate-binding domain-containing protein [Methylibium sp.]